MPRVSPPNKLLSQSCSCYHVSWKLPGKFRKTNLSQPFFPAKKGRYACHIVVQYPRGDSSYHARPRSAYQELSRASARVQNTMSRLEERAQRAHYRTCSAWHARTCADRRARRVFQKIPLDSNLCSCSLTTQISDKQTNNWEDEIRTMDKFSKLNIF